MYGYNNTLPLLYVLTTMV